MKMPELILEYVNTPYLLIAIFVVLLVVVFLYFRKNSVPANELLQSNNLEREFGLSLIGLEDDIQVRTEDDDEVRAFTPSVFASDATPAILVVEPNTEWRVSISNALRLNYRVIALSDGARSYQNAMEMVPDLIIINTYIGGMEGLTLCETLKSSEPTNHIPVVMLTVKDEIPANPGETHLKADAVLVKPFDARELLLCVRNLIDARKRLQKSFREQLVLHTVSDQLPAPYSNFLNKLFSILRHNYHDASFGVEQLGGELSLSKIQLFRKVKALTNRTPGDILRLYRIEQAKLLLSKAEVAIDDLARLSGFASPAAFNKVFKEYTGISPMEYSARPKVTVDTVLD